MFGMLAAVEAWTTRDHKAEWNTWLSWLDEISSRMLKIEGISTEVQEPKGRSNVAPVLHIKWEAGGNTVGINFVAIQTLRFQKNLMSISIRKTHHFVFN